MSKYAINDTTLTAIADSIRAKGGTSDPIQVSNFASAIANLPTGGGDITAEDLAFTGNLGTRFCSGQIGRLILNNYKDLMTFMHYMELMKERGEAFPVLYQEAICLFFAAVQKDPEAFRSFPISQEVQNRFLQFMKVARSMPPAALKQQFGDTYYYYAQFIPTPKRQ